MRQIPIGIIITAGLALAGCSAVTGDVHDVKIGDGEPDASADTDTDTDSDSDTDTDSDSDTDTDSDSDTDTDSDSDTDTDTDTGTCACSTTDECCDGCNPINEGGECDDGLYCNEGETCNDGACTGGSAYDCSSLDDQCNVGVCNETTDACEAQPDNEGNACDDALFCNEGETCNDGACGGGSAHDCSSLDDQCNTGVCNETTDACEAQPANEGDECDDGLFCNVGETCSDGVCGGGSANDCAELDDGCAALTCNESDDICEAEPYPILFDDFADDSLAWTLGPQWEIGPATASTTCSIAYGMSQDPAYDHTFASNDNSVAGIVIGGCTGTAVHGAYCLTSPAVDTSAIPSAKVSYWRWLNADYAPYMHHWVDVWDGSSWQNLWTTGGFPATAEGAWNYHEYDITDHAGTNTQVRFCYDITSSSTFNSSSWNIDDVYVGPADAACQPLDAQQNPHVSWLGPVTVLDGGCPDEGVTIEFEVDGSFPVGNVAVGLNISTTRRSDIDTYLTSPDATTAWVFSDFGALADNLDVRFQDGGGPWNTTNHVVSTPYYENVWEPQDPFTAFGYEDAGGTWTLFVCDDAVGEDLTVNHATLFLESADSLCPDTDADVHYLGGCYYLDGSGGACDPGYLLGPQSVLYEIGPWFAGKDYKHSVSDNCCIYNSEPDEDFGMAEHCNLPGPFSANDVLPGAMGCTNATNLNPGQLTLCTSN